MANIEVFIDLDGHTRPLGIARRNVVRGTETILFSYADDWLNDPHGFPIEPALPLTHGTFAPPTDQAIFGSIGDSAPDTWGRRLMQRAERHRAKNERRAAQVLMEIDYLLGVADNARLGALRFVREDGEAPRAAASGAPPTMAELARLLQITGRYLRNEETEEELSAIVAPGACLGGTRPKVSVVDPHGQLSIAKFPKETDSYNVEIWEEVALRLAERAGIDIPRHELIWVAGQPVLLSRRFDRRGAVRIPFLSAMAMTGAKDGERGSYPEIVEALTQCGARAKTDAHALFRRVVFNVMISNVDDHLRNHGFLWSGKAGWILSPAYDLNPVPIDIKARALSTNIDLSEGTCSIDLLESAAEYFALSLPQARTIIREVATAAATWRDVARTVGARAAEINRMASAFEHNDARRGCAL